MSLTETEASGMLKWWLHAVDDIRREKFGNTEDLRQEGPAEQGQFLKNGLFCILAVGAAVILLQILSS